MKKKPTGIRATRKDRLAMCHLCSCGSALATIAFNLSQTDIPKEHAEALKKWQKEWDAAYSETYLFRQKIIPDLSK